MAHNIFHRLAEGFGTLVDFTKAAQTDLETRRLQAELDRRRATQQTTLEQPISTGNIFQDIAREFQKTQKVIQTIQPPTREPVRLEPRVVSEEERQKITEQPVFGFPVRQFQKSLEAQKEVSTIFRIFATGITRPELAFKALEGKSLTQEEVEFISSRPTVDPFPILAGITKVTKLASQVAKLKDVKIIQGLLRKEAPELVDDVINPLAEKLSKIIDPVKIGRELKGLEKLAIKAKSEIQKLTDGIIKVPPVTSKTPVSPRVISATEAIEVSNANKISAELGKEIRKNPALTPDYIAIRITPSGKKIPAIRADSGVFAPKDFETFDFKDIRGLISGPRGISFNFRAAAFSFDNLTAPKASKRGGWGPMVQTWYKHEESIANRFSFLGSKTAIVNNLANKNGVKINEQTGKQLFAALEGKTKGLPQSIVNLAEELKSQVLDTTRETANQVRKQLGKPEIGFIENYAPHMQDVSFWRRMLTDVRTTITDNFDFIIPNAKKNPHALARAKVGGIKTLETNAWKLIESYVDNLANDIYVSPQIEQLKAIGSVLRGRDQFAMARFLDDYIRQNLVGKPGQIDSLFGITEGTIKRTILGGINMARNISALAFNIVWTAFIQTGSLVLTTSRGGGVTRGVQNTLAGFTRFVFDSSRNARVRKLPTLIVKTEGASVGMTGAGDLDRMAGKIFKSKIESFNDLIGKIADGMEYWLTGSSMSVGYEEATKLGLKGRNADIFANWLGGGTQSQYNKEARAIIMNNLTLRAGFPFSTYAFEVWRFTKTLIGQPGGMPLEKWERLNQAVMFMAGAWLYNQYLEKITGRKIFTVGSGIPIIGGLIDEGISRGRVALGFSPGGRAGGGRAPIAPQEDILRFVDAIGAFVNKDNIGPLRKELIKWGMGFSGIAGAATINRFIDGMIASTQGYMTSKAGKPVFIVEGADRFIAPLLGPYSTVAGKAYLKRQEIKEEKEALMQPIFDEAISLKEIGDEEGAQRIIDALSDEEWETYKKIRTKYRAEKKAEGVKALIPIVKEAQELKAQGKTEEAQALVDSLTEEEFEYYESANDLLKKLRKAKEGVRPRFGDGEIIDDRSLVEVIVAYAQALGTDPIDAFSKIFEGERIRRVDNRTIVVFRMPFEESQAIRSDWANGADLESLRLDHIIPLQLGGTNSEDNLRLIPVEIWEASTDIENHLGKLLRDKKISKEEAQLLIVDFKEGRINAQEILNRN